MLSSKIALRYIFSHKSSSIINLVAIVNVIALSLTVASTLFILSLHKGLEQFIIDLYKSFDPPIRVEMFDGSNFRRDAICTDILEDSSLIQSFSLRRELNVVLECNGHEVSATLIGVDPSYTNVAGIDSLISSGRNPIPENSFGILLGSGLAYELGLSSGAVKPIKVVSIRRNKTFLTNIPIYKNVELLPTGIYTLDHATDSRYAFVPIRQIDFLTSDSISITSIDIKPSHLFSRQDLKHRFGNGFIIKDSSDIRQSLKKMINSERWIIFLLLTLVSSLAILSMTGTINIMKKEKEVNNTILRALGVTEENIRNIFFHIGIFLSVISSSIGLVVGLFMVFLQDRVGFLTLEGDTFLIHKYPVSVSPQIWLLTILFVILVGIVVSKLSTLRVER